VADRTLRAASVHAMPWKGAVPRSACGPDGEAGAAQAWRARGVPPGTTSRRDVELFQLALFISEILQNFE
jgi:hypothetical protein